MHRNKLPVETIEKILNMYNGGIYNNLIRERLKVNIKTIKRVINRNKARLYLEKFGKLHIIESIKSKDLNMEIPINI